MILFVVMLVVSVVLLIFGAFVSGMTLGRTQASKMIVELNDSSYERRCRVETEELRKRGESATIEQKKQYDNTVLYYEQISAVRGVKDTAPTPSGKPS